MAPAEPTPARPFPYEVRDLTTDDLDQYNALLRYAFQVTEQELASLGWQNSEIEQSKFPVIERADILGCYDRDSLVSQFAVYPLEMNVYGDVRPIGFITSVTTYPEYSGHGIMTRLMRQSLERMRAKGQSLAVLYPYSIPLYRHRGWEIISNKISYSMREDQIPALSPVPGFVRRVGDYSTDLTELHDRFARQTHGCLLRNRLAWDEYWRWDEDDTCTAVYYSAAEKPLGYMVYLIKDDVMRIKEMIHLNREAQKGLWQYIRAHQSMIKEVRGNTYFNEPIAFEMDDADIAETVRPYIMGRIVDVEHFLDGYPCRDYADARLRIRVEDPFLEWNEGVYEMAFDHGTTSVSRLPADSGADLSMSIGTLTTLLMGYKKAKLLHRIERIEGDRHCVAALDKALHHEAPYISDYI